ncbi:MAG: CHASE2 domain-containing protein [Anaerolineae bacterium]|nr:CHASE2 domain-containing protein [Anaerolineae bacterium]
MDPLSRSLQSIPQQLKTALRQSLQDRRLYVRLQFGSALGLGVGLILAVALISDVFSTSSTRLGDLLYQAPAATRHVVIVAIDDESLKEIGPLPWSRATLGALIDAIVAASPRVLALDFVLPESTPEDDGLARALERAPTVVQPVIGVETTRYLSDARTLPRFDFVLAPTPMLRTRNTRLAHATIFPDSDGVVRHIPLIIESNGVRYPTLGLAALAMYQQRALDVRLEERAVVWDAQRIPTDSYGQMKIIFANPTTRVIVSAAALLRGRANTAALRDSIVLIGVTSSRAHNYITPAWSARRLASVEVHACVIETIWRKHFLTPQDRLTEIVMIFLMAILAGATVLHFRLLSALALTIIYFLLYLGYAFALFSRGTLVQPFYPLLALVLVFIGAMIFRYFSQERRREALVHLFRRYVAPEAVEQVTRDFDRGASPLSGVQRRVSILCIDLRDVNHLATTLSPEALFQLINQYTTLIVTRIFQRNGAIVQCTGEQIIAAWNLLLQQPDHAYQALLASIEIKEELAAFNLNHTPPLACRFGMGVTTGYVLAGRLSSAPHTEYTVIGEIVSIAERLAVRPERSIFIDEATYARVGDEFPMREAKPVKLRRQADSYRVWQVVLATGGEEIEDDWSIEN